MKYIFLTTIFTFNLLGSSSSLEPMSRKQNLQFMTKINGKKILSSVDNLIANSDSIKIQNSFSEIEPLFLGLGKKHDKNLDLGKINAANPQLATIWNSTVMIFGAAADGVGIGTGFALKKATDGRMIFITNLHVVEKFCSIPQEIASDIDSEDHQIYSCDSLFVLHDVAINTKTDNAEADGAHLFKSEILSIDYFDKVRDLVAFRVALPDDSTVRNVALESKYDLKDLLVVQQNAEKVDPKLKPTVIDGVNKLPLTALNIYLAAYAVPTTDNQGKAENTLIKKQWFKGTVQDLETFENDKKLGFITALRHSIEVLPGTSGGAIALSDGRVIGINSSVEVKQFYAKQGILFWQKAKLETYKSFFAMPATFINDFFDKLK